MCCKGGDAVVMQVIRENSIYYVFTRILSFHFVICSIRISFFNINERVHIEPVVLKSSNSRLILSSPSLKERKKGLTHLMQSLMRIFYLYTIEIMQVVILM